VYAEQAFALFLAGLAEQLDGVTLVGRLDPSEGRFPYRVPEGVGFAPLPHYPTLARPLDAVRVSLAAMRRFWDVLAGVDGVWLLGPHPLSLAFALLARMRGRRVALGVRQDLVAYARNRHPGRRSFELVARALELAFRAVGRRAGVVVVGDELAGHYRSAARLLPICVSLVRERELAPPEAVAGRSYDGELVALSVGRLDAEKNPLLLADVLARLGPRWRLVVCGDGPLAGALAERIDELGLRDRVELRGYVPVDGGLEELYRSSHAFLHVSHTEGMPQVLIEAFAGRLPVVATAVGGVPALADGAALLVPPRDPDAPARELERIASDPDLRERLIDAGAERAREHTLEAETRRVAEFLDAPG
jgi:glycosyltransferase involved in cell wall biosynthesis